MAVILWLIGTAISLGLLYLVIKAAINTSNLTQPSSDLMSLEGKMQRQNQEMLKRLDRIHMALEEQNELLRERHRADGESKQ